MFIIQKISLYDFKREFEMELGLSNERLGKLVGVGYTKIANLDRGDKPIDDEFKELIEQATGYAIQRYYE